MPSNSGGEGSIPCWGVKLPHVTWPKNQNVIQKQYCNKFNNDFLNGPLFKKKKKDMEEKTNMGSEIKSYKMEGQGRVKKFRKAE